MNIITVAIASALVFGISDIARFFADFDKRDVQQNLVRGVALLVAAYVAFAYYRELG